MHFNLQLPTSVENGARRSLAWDVEVVTTDGGHEVRNSRWSKPLRTWEIAFNNAKIGSADHGAVEQMFFVTEGGNHTFDFYDERAKEMVTVRFDSDLQFSHTAGPYHHLDSFTLREVRA